jgi:hypothetical protein
MRPPTLVALLALAALCTTAPAAAHCDSLAGPVVAAARQALASGDPAPVLAWIQPAGEAEVRAVLAEAVAVRALGPQARALADRLFLETMVRVHRAGEGFGFTGLQPADAPVDPFVAAADAALAAGDAEGLVAELERAVAAGVRTRFARAVEARRHADEGVEQGRAFVAAYVELTHHVERLAREAHGETGEPGPHHEGASAPAP